MQEHFFKLWAFQVAASNDKQPGTHSSLRYCGTVELAEKLHLRTLQPVHSCVIQHPTHVQLH